MKRRIPFAFLTVILVLRFKLGQQGNAGNCSFDSTRERFCSWRQENRDDKFDWTLRYGPTLSELTGPSKDHSGKGVYAYIETSSPRQRNDNAKIRNGPFSGVKCLHFYYSMIGDTIGSLIIHQHIHGQDLNIWSKSGEQPGSEWHYDNVTLHGNNYYIIFEGIAGSSFTGDIAIDDIYFTEGTCDGESFEFENVSDDTGGRTSRTFVFGNSSYTFYKNSVARHWTESRQGCKDTGSDLVSIESEKEWGFLKRTIQRMNAIEYYIGLRKNSTSGEWKWISDNSKVSATRGKFPWAKGEPSGDGNCANMYRDYLQDYGLFSNLPCDKQLMYSGYICESPTKTTDEEVPTVGETSARTEGDAGTKTTLRQSLAVTPAAPLTPSKSLSTEAPSKELTTTAKALEGGGHSDNKGGCSIMVKILASLLTVTYAALLVLSAIFYFWQKKQRKEIDARKTTDRGNQLDDKYNLPLSLEDVARQLGFSDEEKPKGARRDNQKRETDQSSRQECGYAMLTPRTTMVTGDSSYASLVKSKQEHCNNKSFVAASSLLPHNEEPHNGIPTYVNV